MTLLCNTFSLSMFSDAIVRFEVEYISIERAKELSKTARSVVGHADTANLFTTLLETPVAFNRESIAGCHEQLLVGQYVGPRLPEGASTLPTGALIRWVIVTPLDAEEVHNEEIGICSNGPSSRYCHT
jgi:hypothetical protein